MDGLSVMIQIRQYRTGGGHFITNRDFYGSSQRQVHIHARTEADETVTLATRNNVEQGKKFTGLYGVDSVAFVFFAPDGKRLNTFYDAQDKESLRKIINTEFHL